MLSKLVSLPVHRDDYARECEALDLQPRPGDVFILDFHMQERLGSRGIRAGDRTNSFSLLPMGYCW